MWVMIHLPSGPTIAVVPSHYVSCPATRASRLGSASCCTSLKPLQLPGHTMPHSQPLMPAGWVQHHVALHSNRNSCLVTPCLTASHSCQQAGFSIMHFTQITTAAWSHHVSQPATHASRLGSASWTAAWSHHVSQPASHASRLGSASCCTSLKPQQQLMLGINYSELQPFEWPSENLVVKGSFYVSLTKTFHWTWQCTTLGIKYIFYYPMLSFNHSQGVKKKQPKTAR